MDITYGISMLLILLGMSIPVIIVFLFLFIKKRFEHKQIMAAIEKGTLSELTSLMGSRHITPSWIKSLTIGIGFLIFSLSFLFQFLVPLFRNGYISETQLKPFGVFFALGTAFFVRGLILRKRKKEQASENPQNNNCSKSETTK